jgi:hypothetical protein
MEKDTPTLEGKISENSPPNLNEAREEDGMTLLVEMATYLTSYIGTQIDYAKLTTRELFLKVLVGILALLIISSILLISVIFFMVGTANGVGNALGGKLWLGYLSTGSFFLLAIGLSCKLVLRHRKKKSLKMKVKNYERELETESKKLGHNELERAASSD